MSRSEEQALKAYPINIQATQLYGDWDINKTEREGFVNGYEQAEKETIERAIAWLKENANKYIVDLTPTYPDAPANIIVGGMCWEHLQQELEAKQ